MYLPFALAKKYPNAPISPAWQYVFPAPNRANGPRSQVIQRHHVGEQQVRRSVARALAVVVCLALAAICRLKTK